mgnify:FL=1
MSQNGLNCLNTNPVLHHTSSPDHPTAVHNSNSTVQSGLTEVSATPRKQPEAQSGDKEPGLPPTPPMRSLVSIDEAVNETGYDSDGCEGPFYEGVKVEGTLIVDDEEEVGVAGIEVAAMAENGENPKNPEVLEIDAVDKMKVLELKAELKKRGVSIRGKKEELINRLKKAIEEKMPIVGEGNDKNELDYAGEGFPLGARWELEEAIDDVNKQDDDMIIEGIRFREPTANERDDIDGTGYQKKKNFRIEIDRPPFVSFCVQPEEVRNQIRDKDKYQYHTKLHKSSMPNIEFFHKRGITTSSHPADWLNCFLPLKNDVHDSVSLISIADITSWTNKKAFLMNAGQGGTEYKDFEPFAIEEMLRHFGLYMLNGIAPSPQIESKFLPQENDQAHGNDLCYRVFGSNAKLRHKQFKKYLASVDPVKPVPQRQTHPNWKCHPMLLHAIRVSKAAIVLGESLSIDEQTIGCKGRHPDIQRISYKREGDGFQCDSICTDGYTYSFYFRNQPAPNEFLMKGLSPLHARCMALIKQLQTQHHKIYMDNLYISARFVRFAWMSEQKVMISGVARKSGRGLPSCVYQEEVTKKEDIIRAKWTVKAAVLKGDPMVPGMVAISIYDSKPFYMISNACEQVKWIKKKEMCIIRV